MKLQLSETEAHCVRQLKRHGGQVWVVGGALRDLLLGLEPHDIDFVTDLPPALSAGAVTQGGLSLVPDRTAFDHGIIRVASQEGIIDIATLRTDVETDGRHAKVEFASKIEDDLARRDFTFNAIAAEISEEGELGILIDPFEGQGDLESRVIRLVRNPGARLEEDALRMIRACRFAALGEKFQIEEDTFRAIRSYRFTIELVSKERIHDEILKAMKYPQPWRFIKQLELTGLLQVIIKPVALCSGVEQNLHHDENVYEHLLYTLCAMCSLSEDPIMRLAALLHDVGKPSTSMVASDGVTHFYQHETEGAKIAYEWMREYKFSQAHTERVVSLIRWHMFHFEDDTKDKTIRRWLREVGDSWKDLLTLRAADRRGNMAKQNRPMITKKMQFIIDKAEELMKSGQPIFDKDLAINGHDLIALGIKPGPIFKEIFQKIWALVINEPDKNTKEYLLEFVRKRCADAITNREGNNGSMEGGAQGSEHRNTGSNDGRSSTADKEDAGGD